MFQVDTHDYSKPSARHSTIGSPLWPTVEPHEYQGRKDEPTKTEIFLQLGVLYWRRGDLDRSERLLIKASEVAEEEKDIKFLAQCFTGLALVKNSLEKTDDAIAAYEHACAFSPENFHIWNNLGKLYAKREKQGQALDAFKRASKINPEDAVAWTGLANAYYQGGSVDEAIRAYKRAIELMSKNSLQQKNEQTVFLWNRLAALYTKKSQYQKAITAYQRVLSFEYEKMETWKKIGALYTKMEAYEDAITAFSKVIELNPECGVAYLHLATTYTKLGKHQESIPFYMKSIQWLDDQQNIKLAIALMENAKRVAMGNNVISNHEKVDEINLGSSPYDEVTWFYYKYNEEVTSMSLSNPTNKLEKLTKGERDMPGILPLTMGKQALTKIKNGFSSPQSEEMESVNPLVWNEKGNIHFKNKAYDDAIMAYNKAIELDPTFGHPYNNLALIQFAQGNFEDAILLYQESIKRLNTKQEKAIACNGLGNAFRCIKDYKSARLAYQNASELDPENGGVYDSTITYEAGEKYKTAEFWNDLGKLFFKAGVYDKAATAFQEAIRLEPSSGYTYGHLARALTAQGKYQEAVSLYHKSIELMPSNKEKANVWNRLGDVHRKLNDYDNALQAYQNGTVLTDNKLNLLNRTRFSLLSNCTVKH